MPRELPEILSTKTLAKTNIFHVEAVDLRFSNGVERQYERLKGSPRGAVLIVPIVNDDTFLLVREYAGGSQQYELAFPKGRIEEGETSVEAGNREMMEEVGYGAKNVKKLCSVTVAPGYIGHTSHIVVAQDLYPKRLIGDEPEALEVMEWNFSDMGALLARDDFTEARSIAALFLVRDYLLNSRERDA